MEFEITQAIAPPVSYRCTPRYSFLVVPSTPIGNLPEGYRIVFSDGFLFEWYPDNQQRRISRRPGRWEELMLVKSVKDQSPRVECPTVTANYVQFWFHRFRSSSFDVKEAPRTGTPVVENVDETPEIIEIDRHVSSRSIAQQLKINHKIFLNYLHKIGFKKKLNVWVRHQLTPKT
ncbi:histone-lysine N-methyltransferase SETMAR [Trichonephila clavipes]|uniref:Histone-lysine N-methyltransferase SETMAR n=1 Tax=Trichonephila clavipes TaxID=2585209 RepID=A0A8X6VZ64_TRICX|nr:histone-lysine N-methyltransferase SETMAR [Trichonephila clavipes]